MKKILKFIMAMLIAVLSAIPCVNADAYCYSHTWVKDNLLSQGATCTSEGSEWYDCLVCGDYKIVKTPATGIHEWTEWKADGELCKEGLWTRYCKNCYMEEKKEREGDGSHIWSEWSIYSWDKPDCLNDGKKHRKCHKCYEEENKNIPPDSSKHDWSSFYMTYDGKYSYRTCYTCKKKQNITLSLYKKTINKGKSFKIKIKRKWNGDKIKGYFSSNKKVATISPKGKVTAKGRGKTTITVKMKSGCRAMCKVTVR